MRRLRQQFTERLSRIDKWQWGLLVAATLIILTVGIHKTKVSAGWWGLLDDEIAVVTIESKDGKQNVTIKDPSKSAWDVLGLLGVPLVLVYLGARFQRKQQEQSDRIAEKQREESEQIAKKQREQDRAEVREEALQLYLDRISTLLIDKNLMAIAAKKEAVEMGKESIHDEKKMISMGFVTQEVTLLSSLAKDNNYESIISIIEDFFNLEPEQKELLEVATTVVQARTFSILKRFENDSERKSSVVQFLTGADVLYRLRISLSEVNLNHIELNGANLSEATLFHSDLQHARLNHAKLSYTKLNRSDLKHATLIDAKLDNAVLYNADLSDADLSHADLSKASLSNSIFHRAVLMDACLYRASLFQADLSWADLSWADLGKADLRQANLSKADLRTAKNLTEAQLSQALLCRTKLPKGINLNPDRDCERLNS